MLKLHDILRAGSVKRWHMVNTIASQSVAEHQYNVTLLSLEIASRMGIEDHSTLLSLLMYALTHDLAETRTGDMPTPTKRRLMERTGVNFNEIFRDFDVVPNAAVSDQVKLIVDCADQLEGLIWLNEHRVGRHADAVYESIINTAGDFLGGAGDTGRIALHILGEVQNAVYQI